MSKIIATYLVKVVVRSDNEDHEPLLIDEIEEVVRNAVQGEYQLNRSANATVTASAERTDI